MAIGNVRRGDARQPLQRLDAALRLFCFGRLGAEAAHEIFQMRDFRLLGMERLILLCDAFSAGALSKIEASGGKAVALPRVAPSAAPAEKA